MKEYHGHAHNTALEKSISSKIFNTIVSLKSILLVILIMCLFIFVSYVFLQKRGKIMKNNAIRYDQFIDHVFTFRNVLFVEILLGVVLVLSSIL